MRPESCLIFVLLVGAEATVVAEEVRGWLVFPTAVGLLWDVVSDANELPVGITDWESDSTTSANVLCGSGNEPSATITDITGRGVEMGRSMARHSESILTSRRNWSLCHLTLWTRLSIAWLRGSSLLGSRC